MNDSISNPGALKKCGLAPALTEPAKGFGFYRWSSRVEGSDTVIRLVTSFATEPAAAEALIAAAARLGNQ